MARARPQASSRATPRRGRELLVERGDLDGVGRTELVAVAVLGRPWGIHGGVTVRLHNPDSDLGWARDAVWLHGVAFPPQAVAVRQWQEKGKLLLVFFDGVATPEDARALTGLEVEVPGSWLSEPDRACDEHHVHELIGMRVIDQAAVELGLICEVFGTGANDVWVVRHRERGETLIPAVEGFVLEVDREARTVRVRHEST